MITAAVLRPLVFVGTCGCHLAGTWQRQLLGDPEDHQGSAGGGRPGGWGACHVRLCRWNPLGRCHGERARVHLGGQQLRAGPYRGYRRVVVEVLRQGPYSRLVQDDGESLQTSACRLLEEGYTRPLHSSLVFIRVCSPRSLKEPLQQGR